MLTWSGKTGSAWVQQRCTQDLEWRWEKKVVILGLSFITSTGQYQLMCIKMRDLQRALVQRIAAFNFEFREEPSF